MGKGGGEPIFITKHTRSNQDKKCCIEFYSTCNRFKFNVPHLIYFGRQWLFMEFNRLSITPHMKTWSTSQLWLCKHVDKNKRSVSTNIYNKLRVDYFPNHIKLVFKRLFSITHFSEIFFT